MASDNNVLFESFEYGDPFPILNFDTHCRSCKKLFDGSEHLPKFLHPCQHTVCLKCLKDSQSSVSLFLITCPECKTDIHESRIVECLETNKYALFMSQQELEKKKNSGSWCVECGSFATFSCQPEHNIFTLTGLMLQVGQLLKEASTKLKEAIEKRLLVQKQLAEALKNDSSDPSTKVSLESKIRENDGSLKILHNVIESFNQTNDAFLEKKTDHEIAKKTLQSLIQMAKKDIFSADQIANPLPTTFPKDINSNNLSVLQDVRDAVDSGNDEYQIFVKLLCGVKTKTLTVKRSDTIQSLKEQLLITENLAIKRQWLVYSGRPLEDEKTLSFYNIFKEATLSLHVRWNVDRTPRP